MAKSIVNYSNKAAPLMLSR